MSDHSLHCLVVFHHLLVVASALLVGTAADGLAHHAVEVPLPPVFLAAFDHRFEFDEEADVLVVLFLTPVTF